MLRNLKAKRRGSDFKTPCRQPQMGNDERNNNNAAGTLARKGTAAYSLFRRSINQSGGSICCYTHHPARSARPLPRLYSTVLDTTTNRACGVPCPMIFSRSLICFRCVIHPWTASNEPSGGGCTCLSNVKGKKKFTTAVDSFIVSPSFARTQQPRRTNSKSATAVTYSSPERSRSIN